MGRVLGLETATGNAPKSAPRFWKELPQLPFRILSSGRLARIASYLVSAMLLQPFAPQPAWTQEAPLVTWERIAFDRDNPEKTRFGPLIYRGGLLLQSRDPRFGGFSGLMVSEDGLQLTAVSDEGHWFTASLEYDETGRLAGLRSGHLERLMDHHGRPLTRKGRADAESLAENPQGGLIVGLEQHHNILAYGPFPDGYGKAQARLPLPEAYQPRDYNSGMEAMARLADGRLLALVEQGEDSERTPGYLWDGAAWTRFDLRAGDSFMTTGATRLPNGDILILERRFNLIFGPAMRLRRIAAESIRAGAIVEAKELVRLAPPLAIDNMEGVSARRGNRGETLIYLISDNNFNLLQRNLLLLFELKEASD